MRVRVRLDSKFSRSRIEGLPEMSSGAATRNAEQGWNLERGSGPHDGDTRENFGHRFLQHLVSTLYRRAARNRAGQDGPTKQARHRICSRGHERRWRTPERLRAFARRQHVTLPLAFDQGKKAHAAFGLSGFPGIVVIDRAGRVCLTRQGYNSSESSFRSDLTQLLESL